MSATLNSGVRPSRAVASMSPTTIVGHAAALVALDDDRGHAERVAAAGHDNDHAALLQAAHLERAQRPGNKNQGTVGTDVAGIETRKVEPFEDK